MKKTSFGDCFYEFNCDKKLLDQSLQHLFNCDITWNSPYVNQSYTGYLNKELTVAPYSDELFNWIQTCIDEVVADQVPFVKLVICDAWYTKTKFLQKSPVHFHKNSILSGIFYLTSHEKTKTVFTKNKFMLEMLEKIFYHGQSNDFFDKVNGNQTEYKETYMSDSVAGKLIIFPSYLNHMISPHKDKNVIRYTLAFNTFLSGTIKDDSSARLEFNTKSVKEKYLDYIAKNNLTK